MISGIINLKKEAGMTSHDAVFKLRKILREKKIGHGGTLDPDVTGVLPIALGKATRLIEYMQEAPKVYEGRICLGFSTTTEDASGQVLEQTPVNKDLTEADIDQAMAIFVGQISQTPPMYSAVKVNGRRLYDYARAGEVVERPVRQVVIYDFVRTSSVIFDGACASFSFRVTCSKGTYVRTLSVDLGARLGYAAHMSHLERTSASGLDLGTALTLSEIEEQLVEEDWSFLQPLENVKLPMAKLEVTDAQKQAIVYGQLIELEAKEELVAAYQDGQLIAILEKRYQHYKPHKVFIS